MSMLPLENNPRYRLNDRLGVGGFSTVWHAWDNALQVPVAIKVFSLKDREGIRLCREEYEKTRRLEHPNVIRLLDFGEDDGVAYITMPYYARGSMEDRVGAVSEEELWRLIRDIGLALSYIHHLQPPFLHNDLKPDNFLIDDNGRFILADFGIGLELSNRLLSTNKPSQKDEQHASGRGPDAYLAPECFSYRGQKKAMPVKASEIWAFGACLHELATGEPPFADRGGQYQLEEQMDHGHPVEALLDALPAHFSRQLQMVIFDCLTFNTWKRPKAEDLVAEAERQLQVIYENTRQPKLFANRRFNNSGALRQQLAWIGTMAAAMIAGAGIMYVATREDGTPKRTTPIQTSTQQGVSNNSKVERSQTNNKTAFDSKSPPTSNVKESPVGQAQSIPTEKKSDDPTKQQPVPASNNNGQKPKSILGTTVPAPGTITLVPQKKTVPLPVDVAHDQKAYGIQLALFSTSSKAWDYIRDTLKNDSRYKIIRSGFSSMNRYAVVMPCCDSREEAERACNKRKSTKGCKPIKLEPNGKNYLKDKRRSIKVDTTLNKKKATTSPIKSGFNK